MWMAEGEPIGPLWLWLGDRGEPVVPATWQSIFRRANERCAKLGIPLEVHPHTLRHYVDGRVMWLAASSPLVAGPRVLVPAT